LGVGRGRKWACRPFLSVKTQRFWRNRCESCLLTCVGFDSVQWRLHYNVDCDQEVDTYWTMAGHQFNEGKLDVKANILMWWKVHAVRFPYLSRLARRYLAMSATSASVERLFSVSGQVVTAKGLGSVCAVGLRRRSGGGRRGGWGVRLVAVAGCGAAGRSVGSASGRAAAPGSLAVLPLWVPFLGGSRSAALRGRARRGLGAAPGRGDRLRGR